MKCIIGKNINITKIQINITQNFGVKINCSQQRIKNLESNLMLFFTGLVRTAEIIAKEQVEQIQKNEIILKEMVEKVFNIFKIIFPASRPVILERIHFIRTKGSVIVHKDEAGRNTCINIGVRNSIGAITKMSNDNIKHNFNNNHSAITVIEGHGYLMNTNQYHAVESINDKPRYLITYGFGDMFDVLKKEFKNEVYSQ